MTSINNHNVQDRIKANHDAFSAYNVLYYPVIGKASFVDASKIDLAKFEMKSEDFARAETVSKNLETTSYVLSENAKATLAYAYALLRTAGVSEFIDPFADIKAWTDDKATGTPMYPNFPSQVIEMSEDEFRAHQAIHYASTYGVEFVSWMLGFPTEVSHGWRPPVENTEDKKYSGIKLENAHVLEIALSYAMIGEYVTRDLSRPVRMSDSALRLATRLLAMDKLCVPDSIPFHENALTLIDLSSSGNSMEYQNALNRLADHPGDILKAALSAKENNEFQEHLKTKQKKALCRALEAYTANDIAKNIADLSKRGEKAINLLSVNRFGGAHLREAVKLIDNKKVVSYNSNIERAFNGIRNGKTDNEREQATNDLLKLIAERPGMAVRMLNRVLMAGVDADKLVDALVPVCGRMSTASLVRLATIASGKDAFTGYRRMLYMVRVPKPVEHSDKLADVAIRLLRAKLGTVETPFAGKRVFVDPGAFSLDGSVIMPNEYGDTSMAYPPAGMAYALPKSGTVRFFTFWDDRKHRVDVDLHFNGYNTNGGSIVVGWNSSYSVNGMTTSGDITDSIDAAEFLDIDLEEAEKSGIVCVNQYQEIYNAGWGSGVDKWADIAKCFSGALLIGDTAPDAALYNSDSVLFHDDMNGDSTAMNYAMIDVPERWVRIMRGTAIPFNHTDYTLKSYIDDLLAAQHIVRVETLEDADIILSVGRSANKEIDGKPVVCLIDEGFFIK